ncbi:MAG TPA: HK97 family phage prohead protease [Roseiflexaceae bacterium]|nr:HK97 family phage prohead protease [Roseiflexaceae bacterium]
MTGIFAVFGNIDSYQDRIHPGAFTRTIKERLGQIFHLWQHSFGEPPTAVVTDLRELTRDQLPPEVRQRAPDATGGMEVTREYLPTPRGDETLTAISAGAPLQMSFAFNVVRCEFEQLPDAKYDWERLRNLFDLDLLETSDVLWGANDATAAHTRAGLADLDSLIHELAAFHRQVKEGRRNATGDLARINQIAALAIELGADNVQLLADDAKTGHLPHLNDQRALERRARAAGLTLRLHTHTPKE